MFWMGFVTGMASMILIEAAAVAGVLIWFIKHDND